MPLPDELEALATEDRELPSFGAQSDLQSRMLAVAAEGGPAAILAPNDDDIDPADLSAMGASDPTGRFSLADDPTAPEFALNLASEDEEQALALAGGTKYMKQDCPTCKTTNSVGEHISKDPNATPTCKNCKKKIPDPFKTSLAQDEGKKLKCPKCDHVQSASNKKCAECGHNLGEARKAKFAKLDASQVTEMTLHLSAEQVTEDLGEVYGALELADLSKAGREKLASKGQARKDGSFPIPNVEYLKKAIRAIGRASDPAAAKAWIKKRAKELKAEAELPDGWSGNASQDQEHDASVADQLLFLAPGKQQDGLLWKVLCKTGTLALSPGPGQVDVDKPLNLTPTLFSGVKQAFDEKAFEHVTIPETHTNGTLENTGTVQHLAILDREAALADGRVPDEARAIIKSDPGGTQYMLGGLNFTEPEVRGKAERGSIINCSVGLKFNYRNKRTGKQYPVAMEHVALTNQPWVDGLPAFGDRTALSGPESDEGSTWDGVFMSPEAPVEDPPEDVVGVSVDTLLAEAVSGEVAPTMDPIGTPSGGAATEPTDPPEGSEALEQILASQQARLEAAEAKATALETQLGESRSALLSQGQQLHNSNVERRIASLQKLGVAPAVLTRVREIMLADYNPSRDEDQMLKLSVQTGTGDDAKLEDKRFTPTEIAEYLLAAMPRGDASDVVAAAAELQQGLQLSADEQREGESAEKKADRIERNIHPERFEDGGKGDRKTAKKDD